MKTSKPTKTKKFKTADVYFKLIDLAQNTEENRWGRFNTLLIIDTVLIAVWGNVLTAANLGSFHCWVLASLCLPGLFLSFMWIELGARTSRYHQYYISKAKVIEGTFHHDSNTPKIMTEADSHAKSQWFGTITSSTFIVSKVPFFFVLIFIGLLIISFLPR